MFYKKKGLPEVGDIIVCTVKKILYHSVFVDIDEYESSEGMIHISEVSPGRIRNLRDFVKEGKKIVCKVLRINNQGNIDLSLRRVSTSLRIKKLNEIKQEEKAEKLLQYIGKQLKKDLKSMYKEVGYQAIKKFGSLNDFFLEIVINGMKSIEKIEIPKKTSDVLLKIVREKISVPEVRVAASLRIKLYSSNGIEEIKKILSSAVRKNIKISYLGAPKYKIEVTALNYKKAESDLKSIAENILKQIKKLNGEGEYHKIAA